MNKRMIYFLIIIGFILDNLFLNNTVKTINNLSLFPMFSLATLIFCYYYIKEDNSYLILSIFLGLLIDIMWTNTLIFYALTYLLIAIIIILINRLFTVNFINYMATLIILIIVEQLLTYLFLYILSYHQINLGILIYKILKSIPLTLIYATTLYFLFEFLLNKKMKLRRKC